MIRIIETIVVIALLIFSFFVGVKYSNQVKERAGWIFETKEEEIELPEINSQENLEEQQIDENGQVIDQEGIVVDEEGTTTDSNTAPVDSQIKETDSSIIEEVKPAEPTVTKSVVSGKSAKSVKKDKK